MGIAYCIKCKSKQEVKDGAISYARNGALMEKGTCITCGVGVMRFVPKSEMTSVATETPVTDQVVADTAEAVDAEYPAEGAE